MTHRTKAILYLSVAVFFSRPATAQQTDRFQHVDFAKAYGAVTACPTNITAARALMVLNKYMGIELSPKVTQSDSALKEQTQAAFGQTDSSINQGAHANNPTKQEGREISQAQSTAETVQAQMKNISPEALQNMSMADKMKFAQQLMGNQTIQQSAHSNQAMQPVIDTFIKLKPIFDSLSAVMQQMVKAFSDSTSAILTSTESIHHSIDSVVAVRDSACHGDTACLGEVNRRARQEHRDAENAVLPKVAAASQAFGAQFQPLVNKVNEYQMQLHDGNDLHSDPVRNSYRWLVIYALGGPLALQSSAEDAIKQGSYWADAAKP